MVSGKPIKDEERLKIIELHKLGYFPSIIARHLSDRYAHLNGGSRDEETVKRVIKHHEIMGDAGSEELPDLSPAGEPKHDEVPEPEIPKPVKAKVPDMRAGNGRKKARA